MRKLPAGFRFGTATAAAQIEGAAAEDGRGPSIWDTFAAVPGNVVDGDTPAVAVDHYRRWREDVDLIAGLGAQDYRFSVSWSRVLPEGTGATNPAGLDFYDRLVDALLAKGVRPVPTLYHWDLPQPLQDAGGWLSRSTAHALAYYAEVVAARLADRVELWLTMNEMSVHTLYGHALTSHAPGLGLGLGALPAAHHQLLAHGLAVERLRAAGVRQVGLAQQHFPVWPASDSADDVAAAEGFATLTNWMFSDPLLLGRYPEGLEPDDPRLADDLRLISAPLDVYGVNYYEPTRIEARRPDRDYSGTLEVDVPEDLPFAPVPVESEERTDFGWAVVPDGLREILVTLHQRYPDLPPVVVTENGCSYREPVDDEARIRYLDTHLTAVEEAVAAGVDVRGYYVWSTLDNFEWAAGYRERFGLVHVDRETQRRTPKQSYHWYRDLIRTHRKAAT